MKINELEKALGIPRASIRFYEKEGLLSPRRHDNGYRDYDDNDLKTLKTIIVLRKMGISVEQIRRVMSGRLELSEAVEKSAAVLRSRKESLNGAIKLCNDVLKYEQSIDSFDADVYWRCIVEGEKNGESFASIANDLLNFESRIVFGFDAEEDTAIHRKLLYLVVFVGMVAVLNWLISRALYGRGIETLTETLSTYAAVMVIFAVVFFVKRKNEKAGNMFMKVIGLASVIILLLLILLVIILLLNSKAHFLF